MRIVLSRPARVLLAALLALVCAAPALAQEAEASGDSCLGKVRLRGKVFDTTKHDVLEEAKPILDGIARAIQEGCQGRRITIEGHTDLYGDATYNRGLSQRRAEEVKAYLVARGIPADQLVAEGFGSDRPLTRTMTREQQALNRRITFVVEGVAARPVPPPAASGQADPSAVSAP